MSSLEELAEQVKACSRCPLRGEATQPVPGIGDINAKYFIIGEAPGREEDKTGCPFVGLAGRRLNKLLALAGIVLPRLVALVADHFLARDGALPSTGTQSDITAASHQTWYEEFVAWLREYYQGGQ